ncbi:HU family DNA-binding protein [Chitinibacter tainanensis]|uniref:HU family DNA-binding protein n=1 Tax=Chitinibacter tainanensis TaxID=230667 RepID=UPI00041756A7|nr:HU family DNA-binding protein [Chitinibacter tainanensis]
MTRKELAAKIAADHNITKALAEQIVKDLFDTIAAQVKAGDKVTIADFGTFQAVDKAAAVKRNPANGENVNIPAHRAFKFKPVPSIKKLPA